MNVKRVLRRAGVAARWQASLWALVAAAFILAGNGVPRARAQGQHVHHWTAYTHPDNQIRVTHCDGQDVTTAYPARPCELLRLERSSVSDYDRCDAAGCSYTDGVAWDDPANHSAGRWTDRIEPFSPGSEWAGHFGYVSTGGQFTNSELFDPVDQVCYGLPSQPVYRVARDQPSGSIIRFQNEVLNEYTPFFRDPPIWTGGIEIPVIGDRCWVPTGRFCSTDSCAEGSPAAANSSVTPLTGNLSFQVPVTSWGYGGEEIEFNLTYHSRSLADASLRGSQVRNPSGISDNNLTDNYNPKWGHTFAQWVEVHGTGVALWHQGSGLVTPFQQYWVGQAGPYWRHEGSYRRMTSAGSATSPQFTFEDDVTTVTVPYSSFTITEGDQTRYIFSQVRWNLSETPARPVGYAVPYFLLTQIVDRWGRTINVTWNDNGVATVRDGDNRGLDFSYSDGLLAAVTDPAGRTHTFQHQDVPTPSGGTQPKLTGVTVQGVGSPNRTRYCWSFAYTDPAGYGGTVTNDLVTTKTEPSGKVVHYEFEPVNLQRASNSDWSGRLARTWYADDLMNPPATREIRRQGTTITYPGGDAYEYEYNDEHIIRVQHENTGAEVFYSWDAFHNLTTFRTSSEQLPLVILSYTYTDPDGRHIAAIHAQDILGRQARGLFNLFNLPTESRLCAAPGSGHADQVSQFVYDNGGALVQGNLTRLLRALGTPSEETADFEYALSGFPSLPSAAMDSVGAVSSATYHPDGSVFQSASPANLLAPVGDPDRAPSVSATTQNLDELPAAITDPMGHSDALSYNAESPGSSRLVVTVTHSDASTARVTLDANGDVVKAVDENGVCTRIDRNRAGQPLRTRRAEGTSSQRVTCAFYDAHDDLCAFDPPAGPAGRVYFEYCRYNLSPGGGPPEKEIPEVYLGQVTRIRYPDGTTETFGYNSAEEPEWRCGPDGRVTRLYRDSLHRVYQVDIPQTPGYPAFSISVVRDEFGRVTSLSDANGTSSYSWDDLNRLTFAAPAMGNAVAYQYLRDLTLQRWTTRATMNGVGAWEWGDDTKGRAAQVLNPFGQLATTRFDPDGKPVQESRANGTVTDYTYTPRDWLAGIQHRLNGGAVLDTFQYFYTNSGGAYDPAGHLQREVDAGGRTHAFAYNPLYELTAESHPDTGTTQYALDPNGNRTCKATSSFTEFAGYDAQNKLLWTNQAGNFPPSSNQAQPYRLYSYNVNGEPTNIEHREQAGQGVTHDQLDWDGMGKLRRLFCTGAYQERYRATYDGFGDRVTARLDNVDHVHSFGAGLLHDSAGNTVYTPGVSQRKDGTDAYFHEDWIGSTRYLTDAAGGAATSALRYDAFGNTTAQAGADATALKFAGAYGYQSDAGAGLQLLGERYYDPAVGRFLNPDPIGFSGGLNLYGYCAGNPVGRVDPSGLDYGWYPGPPGQLQPDYPATMRLVGRTIWDNGGEIWRGLIGIVDPGVSELAEFFTETEAFTERHLTPGERWTGLGCALLPIPTNLVRGAVRGLARQSVRRSAGVLKGKGFKSFYAFKRALGPAGQGYEWHHVVEQTRGNVLRFGPEAIHHTENVVRVPSGVGSTHNQISAFYSSKQAFTGPLTVRKWLSTESYDYQHQFGMDTLKRVGYGP